MTKVQFLVRVFEGGVDLKIGKQSTKRWGMTDIPMFETLTKNPHDPNCTIPIMSWDGFPFKVCDSMAEVQDFILRAFILRFSEKELDRLEIRAGEDWPKKK